MATEYEVNSTNIQGRLDHSISQTRLECWPYVVCDRVDGSYSLDLNFKSISKASSLSLTVT